MDKLVAEVMAKWPTKFASNLSFTVAISGGVDSVVLLHLINEIFQSTQNKPLNFEQKNIQHATPTPQVIIAETETDKKKCHTQHVIPDTALTHNVEHNLAPSLDAIHINHNISPNAQQWANFCHEFCKSLEINLTVCNVQIGKSGGESLENNARKIRYAEFFKHNTNVIILAHHKMDQIETTLSQIFRGSDLHNIAAMKEISYKHDKIFWRPLLNFTKAELEDYAKRHSLQYITDESNTDCQYLRNFIRHDILPRLIKWDKNIIPKILNFNTQIQENMSFIDEIAVQDIKNVTENTKEDSIDLIKFKQLSTRRQHNVLSHFILTQNLPLPSNKQIQEFTRQLNTCQADKLPSLKLGQNHEIIMQRQKIFIRNT